MPGLLQRALLVKRSHSDLAMSGMDPTASVFACAQGIAANLALVVAGNYMKWVNATFTQGSVLLSLRYLVSTVVVMSGVMMASKLYMDANIKSIEVPTATMLCNDVMKAKL